VCVCVCVCAPFCGAPASSPRVRPIRLVAPSSTPQQVFVSPSITVFNLIRRPGSLFSLPPNATYFISTFLKYVIWDAASLSCLIWKHFAFALGKLGTRDDIQFFWRQALR